jgi:chromosome segregation ATPase
LSAIALSFTSRQSNMNLLGKAFVVAIFAAAVVFMAFSISLFMSQRNFRDIVMLEPDKVTPNSELGLKHKLANAKARNEELKKNKTDLETQLAAEKATQQQSLCKLQTEFDLLKMERKGLEELRASLEKKKRDLVDAMDATQKNTTNFRGQLEKVQGDVAQAQKDRDDNLKEVVRKTDELNQAVNEKELLRKRMAELAKDLAKAVKALK